VQGQGCNNKLEIRYQQPPKVRAPRPKLKKDWLVKPGTDTSSCCACPQALPCCPCPENNVCDACCGNERECKLHMAAAIPTRKYPIVWNTPRFVPDPREPPVRPKLLCAGGMKNLIVS